MTRNNLRVLCFVLGLSVFFAEGIAYAQSDPVNSGAISYYGLRNLPNAILISATPSTPAAGETVHLTVEGSVYDFQKDTITWTVNGKVVASGAGESSIDAAVNSKGDSLDVVVDVVDPIWGEASNEITIVPVQVDILYDAPSYVPPFYRGRALPGAGGTLRLQAVARFIQSGAALPNSSITYTWSRNGSVLGSVSGRGKSQISIDAPALYGADTISVHASANSDTLSANASIAVPSAPLTLKLYEDHPLFGVTYFNALAATVPTQNVITVSAVPYFATAADLSDPALQYTWLLNDAPLSASSTKRNEVTLSPAQSSARLHLNVTSSDNFFLGASGDWLFQFSNSGGSTITKPGSGDVFHNGNI